MSHKLLILLLTTLALSLISPSFCQLKIPDQKKDLILNLDSSKKTQSINVPLNKEFYMKLSYDARTGFGFFILSNSGNRSLLTYDLGKDMCTRIQERTECKENLTCLGYQYYRFKSIKKGKYVVKFTKNMLGYAGDTIAVDVNVN